MELRSMLEVMEHPDTPVFSIGTAAQLLGISPQTLRTYEAEGLILPVRTASHQRRYSRSDLQRVQCMRQALREGQMTIPAIKRMMALIPCWEVTHCSEKERAGCPAYRGHTRPCWSYRHMNNTCAERECRECRVYHLASNCDTIKSTIISLTTKS